MTKLTTEQRKNLKKSEFGEPKERKYPMPDKNHARNAKARASEMEHKGKLSKSQEYVYLPGKNHEEHMDYYFPDRKIKKKRDLDHLNYDVERQVKEYLLGKRK